MGARLVLNLRSLGGVRANGAPPSTYFIDAVPPGTYEEPGYLPGTSDPDWESNSRPRPHVSYGEVGEVGPRHLESNFPRHPPPKRRKEDPYFYNRQASHLRALPFDRPDVTFKAPSPSTLPPAHIPPSGYSTSAQIEEAVARSRMTPKPGASRRSSVSTRDLGSTKHEVYNLQTWSVVIGSQSSLTRHDLPSSSIPTPHTTSLHAPVSDGIPDPQDQHLSQWRYI